MTLPTSHTLVLYPAGATTSESRVVHVEPVAVGDDVRLAVLLDQTACHPVDAAWPDQGPDRAVLDAGDVTIEVLDCVVGATDGETLYLGADVPVRKGTDGWAFVVAHLVTADAGLTEGDSVTVVVDAAHRTALSAGHTGCHLASLALNAALAEAGAWTKDVALDAAGAPDFDALAIESSTIVADGSVDVYRVGKSLRKKGFSAEALADVAGAIAIEGRANALLAGWLGGGGGIRIDCDGDLLTDRRYWVAELPVAELPVAELLVAELPTVELPTGEVRIPCGGTHAESLAALASVTVALAVEQLEGAVGMTMTTSVDRA